MKTHHFKNFLQILKNLEESKETSNEWTAHKSIGGIYQVEGYMRRFKVDLSQHHCSCRRWDLTGIPCSHAVACIRKKGEKPEDYIHNCYTIESYLRSNTPTLMPICSLEQWHKTRLRPPLPPKYKKNNLEGQRKRER